MLFNLLSSSLAHYTTHLQQHAMHVNRPKLDHHVECAFKSVNRQL